MTIFKNLAASAVLTLSACSAHAAILSPGDMVFLPGTTLADQPELAGSIINDDVLTAPVLGIPVPSPISFVGFLIDNRVERLDADGSLVFGPRIDFGSNVTSGFFFIDQLVLRGFGSFDIDANYRTDLVGDRGPTFASRSADGDELTLDFEFPLVSGTLLGDVHEESYFMSLRTDATAFENTGRATIFGRHEDHPGLTFRLDYSGLAVPTITPAPIPLPASGVLMLGGLAMAFRLLRKSDA